MKRFASVLIAAFAACSFSSFATTDSPGCEEWVPAASCNYTVSNRPSSASITYVVIHKAEGSAASAASWFQNCAAGGSAQYSFDRTSGYCYQSVRDKDISWHTGSAGFNPNLHGIGIEHGGYTANNDTQTACYQHSSEETRGCITYYGVPYDRSHILGHQECPGCNAPIAGGNYCHYDPGQYWNWSTYMSYCNPGGGGDPWKASFAGQSYPAGMAAGSQAWMELDYQNEGTNTWDWLVRLATSNPRGATGYLYASGHWLSGDRACGVGANTATGQIGHFHFVGQAPSSPGYYKSHWELVRDGTSWFEGTGDDAWFGTNVAYSANATIEAEDFTGGGDAASGADYWDATSGNAGGAYRSTNVDIQAKSGGGYNVGWSDQGEWLQYYFNNTASNGWYIWYLWYANGGSAAQVQLTVNGSAVGTMDLGNTGGWQNWQCAAQWVQIGPSGVVSLGLYNSGTGCNYDAFVLDGPY